MYQRIIVGTDGSRGAEPAIERAGELALAAANAGSSDVEVHLVSAYHPLVGWEMGDFAGELASGRSDAGAMERISRGNLAEAETQLRRLGLDARGVKVDQHPMIGTAFDVLIAAAKQFDADLIVVGSRGHGVGKRLLLGSVSTKVVHHATCSVLIVHDEDSHDQNSHDQNSHDQDSHEQNTADTLEMNEEANTP